MEFESSLCTTGHFIAASRRLAINRRHEQVDNSSNRITVDICVGTSTKYWACQAESEYIICIASSAPGMGGPAPMAPSVAFAAFAMNRPNFEPSPEPPGKCLDPRLMLVSFARFRASRRFMYSVPCSHTMAALTPYADLGGAFCTARVFAPVDGVFADKQQVRAQSPQAYATLA